MATIRRRATQKVPIGHVVPLTVHLSDNGKPLDMEGLTAAACVLTKPDGSTMSLYDVEVDGNSVQFAARDLDQLGLWTGQVTVDIGPSRYNSDPFVFKVIENAATHLGDRTPAVPDVQGETPRGH
jgi:hypothetical protein